MTPGFTSPMPECGHVGCCDSSKNKHATKHFHHTQHPIMKSLEAGENWGWCYCTTRSKLISPNPVGNCLTTGGYVRLQKETAFYDISFPGSNRFWQIAIALFFLTCFLEVSPACSTWSTYVASSSEYSPRCSALALIA